MVIPKASSLDKRAVQARSRQVVQSVDQVSRGVWDRLVEPTARG